MQALAIDCLIIRAAGIGVCALANRIASNRIF
jgi:hypothetical protein